MPESALSPTSTAIPRLVASVLAAKAGPRPIVTLSWAQSRDGAIAQPDRTRAILSGPESMALTHRLRSLHRGILVGIGTVLADDPQLTVRLVEGPSPQPVVLDSALRTPCAARLLQRSDSGPWIIHSQEASPARARELEQRGARLFSLPRKGNGLPLLEVLRILSENGIDSLMVEGGARVLRSFLSGGLAQQAVVTVSPVEMNGLRIFDNAVMPAFAEESREKYGPDLVTWGRLA
ncbi:MAG: RibD family protein [Spirochaetia bacterium]